MSVRLKLPLSYAALLLLAGAFLLAAVRVFLPSLVPPGSIMSFLLRDFVPVATIVLAFLLAFGNRISLVCDYTGSAKELVDSLSRFEHERNRGEYPIVGLPEFRILGKVVGLIREM